MRITFPKAITPATKTSKNKIAYRLFEIGYNTIIPVFCSYMIIKYDMILFILPLLAVIIIRFEGEK